MRRLVRRDFIVLYAALALLLLIAVFSLGNWRDFRAARIQEESSRRAFEQIENLLSDITGAETGQRGFLLTGERAYLAAYRRANARVEAELGANRFEGEPATVEELKRAVRGKLDELARTVRLRLSGEATAAIALVQTGEGQREMERIRALSGQLIRNDIVLLSSRRQMAEQHAGELGVAATVGSTVICLFLAVALGRIREHQQREQGARDLLQATLNSIGDAVITTDVEGRVTFINPVAEQLTGWPLAEASGRPVREIFFIVNYFTREPVENPVAKVLQSGTVAGLANHTILLGRSGAELPIDDCGAPIRGVNGKIAGVVLVFRDVSERYKARLALEDSERRHRELFQNNPQPMWMFDVESLRFLDVNEAAILSYGYSREEFLSMTLRDLRPSEEEIAALLLDVEEHKNVRHSDGPWRHRKKNGALIDVEITAVPIEVEGARAKFVLATDVTARLQTERELRRSEERYRVIVETASEAIITIDENSTVVFASPPVLQIFGYRPEEIVGKPLTLLIPEPLRAAHLAGFQRYLETNERNASWALMELPGLHKNGSEILLELSFGEFQDGVRRLFTGVIRDVSDRRRALDNLHQARNLIKTVFDTVPLAIWGVDLLGNVTFWNRAAEALFGWSEDEVAGKLLPIVPEEQASEFQQWLGAYATGQHHAGMERKRLRKDGSLIDCSIWTAPLRSTTTAVTGTVGIVADITERKRAEQEAARYVRYLGRTNADLQQFAYAASHDLQEPLRQVATHTEMFERRFGHLVPPEGRDYLSYAREGAFRIWALVDALRDYWNVQHKTLELRPVSLDTILQNAITGMQTKLSAREGAVTWDNLPVVCADEGLVTDLFAHLLDNALKFSPGKPVIHVSAQADDKGCTVSVRDQGIGMESQYVEQIFRIFQRLSRNYEGVGIGLSLSKQIMERHEGRIWIESALNAGTVVHVQFPRRL